MCTVYTIEPIEICFREVDFRYIPLHVMCMYSRNKKNTAPFWSTQMFRESRSTCTYVACHCYSCSYDAQEYAIRFLLWKPLVSLTTSKLTFLSKKKKSGLLASTECRYSFTRAWKRVSLIAIPDTKVLARRSKVGAVVIVKQDNLLKLKRDLFFPALTLIPLQRQLGVPFSIY